MTEKRKDGGSAKVRSVTVPTTSVQMPFGITPPPAGAQREIHPRRRAPAVPTGGSSEAGDESPPADLEECSDSE